MKRFFVGGILVCLISLGGADVYGKEMPYFREKVEIPPEIARTTTVSELQAFLQSSDEVMRIAAARRLGQLGNPEAVSLLMDRFAKEPYQAAMDSTPYVKIEIIEALGKIGGEEAKKSLLNIFNTYWKQGPKSKRYVWEDSDYASVVPATLEALYTWKDEKEIFDMFRSIYLEERKIPDWSTRQKAYELYLRAKMAKEGLVTVEQSIKYLSPMLTSRGAGQAEDWVKGKEGVKTLEALKNGAIVAILKKHAQAILPYIEEEINKVDIKNITPAANNRREAFIYIKHCIEERLKKQSEKTGVE